MYAASIQEKRSQFEKIDFLQFFEKHIDSVVLKES